MKPSGVTRIQIVLFIFCLALLPFVLTGCASKPQLYPNAKYKQAGEAQAEADIDACEQDAEKFLKSPRGKNIARGAGGGAVVGGAIGAVAGIFTGNVAGGAVTGAAVGGVGGGAAGAMKPDEIKRRYINQCLSEKGYQVLGWD